MAERAFLPPSTPGEAFRADPSDPAPFLTENDKVPVVPVESGPIHPSASPPIESPPTYRTDQPVFQAPSQVARKSDTPEERFAKIALWTGVASVFVFQLILGPAAIVMGIMSIRRGETRNGWLAVLFGTIGVVFGVVVLVLTAMGIFPTTEEMLKYIRENR